MASESADETRQADSSLGVASGIGNEEMLRQIYKMMQENRDEIETLKQRVSDRETTPKLDPTSVKSPTTSARRIQSDSNDEKDYLSRTVQRARRTSQLSGSDRDVVQFSVSARRKRESMASESHLRAIDDENDSNSQFWDNLDSNFGGHRKALRELEAERANRVHKSVNRRTASRSRRNPASHDEIDSLEEDDSDLDLSEQKLKQMDREKLQSSLERENNALKHRLKEMSQLSGMRDQAPSVIQTQRMMPSTDHIILDGLDVISILRFLKRVTEFEAKNDLVLNPIKYVDLQIKTRLQAHFTREGIATDMGWLTQSRSQFFSRLQEYSRPKSVEVFIQILNSGVSFKKGFHEVKDNWEEFLVAVHNYAERFKRLWMFMALNNRQNSPRIDNKQQGALQIFLSKFPNSFGMSTTRELIRERYHSIEAFISDFLEIVCEQRTRLTAFTNEMKKFAPLTMTNREPISESKHSIVLKHQLRDKKHFIPYKKGAQVNSLNTVNSDSDGAPTAAARREVHEDSQSESEDADVEAPVNDSECVNEPKQLVESLEQLELMNITPAKTVEADKQFTCYGQAMYGKCDKGTKCTKDHTQAACQAYLLRVLDILCKSPYLKIPEAVTIINRNFSEAKVGTSGNRDSSKSRSFAVLHNPQLSVLHSILTSCSQLGPMHVKAILRCGDDAEIICLLDSGASHANYISEPCLRKHIPNYESMLTSTFAEVRTGDNSKVVIKNKIIIPVSLIHNGEETLAEITCCVLANANVDLIIGLPSMTCEFFELAVKLLYEAKQTFHDNSHGSLNALIRHLPYHGYPNVAVDAFDEHTKMEAPEEEGIFDHKPDSFPGLIDVLDSTAQEKFRELKELQTTRVNSDLPKRCELIAVLDKFAGVFYQSNFDGLKHIQPIDLETKADMPLQHKPEFRYVSVKDEEAFNKEINRMKTSMYTVSQSPIVHPIVVAPKATSPFIRICGDYRWINQYIVKPHWPIPIVKDAMRVLQKGKIYGEADITNSFHQLPLTSKAMGLLSVSIPRHGTYMPTKMPEGVSSASEHLQRIMSQIFEAFIQEEWLLVIFDNIVIVAEDSDDLIEKTAKFLQRCHDYNLFLKFTKCTWGFQEIDFFGYRVSSKGYYLTEERGQALDGWQFPRTTKKMQSFLGFTLFYAPFVPNYSERAARLYECVHKDFNFKDESTWKHKYIEIFQEFKEMLKTTYMIVFPDYSLEWQLFTDASDLGVAGILFQVNQTDEIKRLEVIAFVSQKFSDVALRWSTIEKECYAIYYTLKVLKRMLWGKEFTCFTDHANLRQLEKSDVFKLQRWANFMASFSMKIVHIAGSNNPSDAGSRSFDDILPKSLNVVTHWETAEAEVIGGNDECSSCMDVEHTNLINTCVVFEAGGECTSLCLVESTTAEEGATIPHSTQIPLATPDELFHSIHNSKIGHWGVQRTYNMANKIYPGHHLPIKFFQERISSCPLCQKYRTGHIGSIEPMTLHMKVQTRRAAIGADVLKITPTDKNGNIGLLVIVTMSTKMVSLHAIRDESSLTLAKEFFLFYSRYGLYDVISVDPGSNISQSVVADLHTLLGIKMKISLVDRHESNGAEGTNAQILRHIRILVQHSRVKEHWGDATYLACCQYILNSHVNHESSNDHSPFELTFGSEAAPYFQTIGDKILSIDAKSRSSYLEQLNEHLKTVWEATLAFQQTILDERIPDTQEQNIFQPGDLILHLESKRPSKLDAEYSGPYSVIAQIRNTVECRHVSAGVVKFLHVSRIKPFFGTASEAFDMAMRDKDQFVIKNILAYHGDPIKRLSLEFQVQFADDDVRWVPWSKDLFDSLPYESYCRKHRHLFPLLFSLEQAKREIRNLSKKQIVGYKIGSPLLVILRSFGEAWYQSLSLPDVDTTTYVVRYAVTSIAKDAKSLIIASQIFKGKITIDSYYLFAFTVDESVPHVEVTSELIQKYPELIA